MKTPVEAEEDRVYMMLRFKNEKLMRVHFVDITYRTEKCRRAE
ncbi:MAG: hypothetical protein ABS897_01935 [Eubacteriales bacterium]